MATVEEGKAAPAFTLPAHTGEKVSLKDFKGKKQVVLYFYPKDDTPGCTKEACSFRDNLPRIESRDAVVLGVSRDSVASHVKFKDKYDLPFLLLSDEREEVCNKYGVIQEKNMCGRKVMGIVRSTFVIGKDGKIKKIFRNVKVDGHTEQVLAALSE
ncbi:MAG TPA: thioredoxin-dependent thiol peroxidase [bacterium]|nr:thioredoxin-dependent thiol peroxidase [bacterium]HOL94919.1 thioredoxin-dependent thiol peroxidase [bacterium]HPP01191.1 thioredoxin-dependent thiol peroxidase [bacterium]